MTSTYDYRLTEEIARWAFEVNIRKSKAWYIAFTNPTAGPWKRVMANTPDGVPGEVYRFPRDNDRPDLILVSDTHKTVLIIEAKDSLPKLLVRDQMAKSVDVIASLARVLKSLRHNKYWGARCDYSVVPGVLWGADTRSEERIVGDCVRQYGRELNRLGDLVSTDFLAIEVVRNLSDKSLACTPMMFQRKGAEYIRKECVVVQSLLSALDK